MSRSKSQKVDNSTTMKDDPLDALYQLDIDTNYHLEEKALTLMVSMLDNLENFQELSGALNKIMAEDEILETRLLKLFKVLINGIKLENIQLGYIP